MSEILPLTGPVDLEALDQFLMSDASPEDCMQLSDLDGFLTGIAIGPELIMPSEWLPAIWGGDEPVFEDEEQARTVLGAIMGRYNEILHALNTDPEAYEPLFWEGPDGEVIAADWAEGFVDAIRLRPEAWRPLLEDREALILLIPILALCGDERRRVAARARSGGGCRPAGRGAQAHPGVRGRHGRVLERASWSACCCEHQASEEPEGRPQRALPLRLRPQVQALLRRQLNSNRWQHGYWRSVRPWDTASGSLASFPWTGGLWRAKRGS